MLAHMLSLVIALMVQRIAGQCQDAIPNCSQYGQTVCSDPQYASWVTQNCQSFCRKCSSGGGGAVPVIGGGGGSCTDAIQNCAQYGATACSDPQYAQWATQNCARTCNKCGAGGGGTVVTAAPPMGTSAPVGGGGSSCTDAIQNCAQYGNTACSDPQYAQWATQNCARTCNKCSSGGGGGGFVLQTQAPVRPVATMAPSGGGGCTDTIQDCSQYGQSVCSDPQYDAWARQNCPRFCNKCSSGGGGGVMPATQAPGGGSGGTFTGQSSGCAYKGQVYQQGQSWDDGCQYKCTCVDGSQGQYSCQEKCYTFNLPPACQMVGPAPGKCCKTPQCPPSVTIQYPPGYVVN